MKIIIPILGFGASGGFRVLSKLADNFIDSGHEVEFVAPKGRHVPYYPTKAKIKYYYWLFSKTAVLRHIFLIIGMTLFLVSKRKSTDIYLANANVTAFPVFITSIFSKKGFYYIQAYEPDFSEGQPRFRGLLSRFFAKLSYKLPLKRIVNAEIYKRYKQISSDYVVEPGIDLGTFFDKKHVFSMHDEIVVGCIGRKEPWKGTKHIIEAVKEIRKEQRLNIKLKIAFNCPDGYDGEEFSFIEIVQPHGDVSLAEYYRSTDIFCATGLIQNGAFHYPCMEAMASGVPVISNYSPADQHSAILLDIVNVVNIKNSIENICNAKKADLEQMLTLASGKVCNYSWPAVSNKMIAIFENVK